MTIAYLNVATDRQQLDIQRKEISSFASSKAIHVDKWVMEVSGVKAKQPGWKLMLIVGRMKEKDVLIVSDITRLCLTLYELMGILTVCMEKGVTVYCIKDRYIFDDRVDRQFMIKIFKLVDEIDHSLISIRTKEALAAVRNSGKQLGRPRGSDSKLYFLDTHKEEILNMLERGESTKTICEYFDVSKATFYKYRKRLSGS